MHYAMRPSVPKIDACLKCTLLVHQAGRVADFTEHVVPDIPVIRELGCKRPQYLWLYVLACHHCVHCFAKQTVLKLTHILCMLLVAGTRGGGFAIAASVTEYDNTTVWARYLPV